MLHTALILLPLNQQNSCGRLKPKSNCPAKTPSGLAQIAVPTMLVPSRLESETLPAEPCRYGAMDLPPTESRSNSSQNCLHDMRIVGNA
jgi:hypothetical protein